MIDRLPGYARTILAAFCVAGLTGCGMLPPATPDAPDGPTSGTTGVSYPFTTVTRSAHNHPVAYRFNWGDGRQSDWSPYMPPGEPVTMWHAWTEPGDFGVRAQAVNALGMMSGWSPPLSVAIGAAEFPDTVVATIQVAGDPTDIAVRPDGRYIYVANEAVAELTVIRTSDRTVAVRVPCGRCPWMVNVSPDGQWVYVSNATDATVTVIRTSDHTVAATVPVGASPAGACFSPDGDRAYVTNQNSNSVSVIRTSDHTVIATIPVGSVPRDADVLPGGGYLYVANLYDNTLTRIRTSDNVVVATVALPFRGHRVRALPGDRCLYVSEYQGSRIAVVSVSENRVTATFQAGQGPIGICNLGSYAYIANHSGTVSIVRTADHTVVGRVEVGDRPWSVQAPASGRFAASCNRGSRTVSVIGHR